MLQAERLDKIKEYLATTKYATIHELAEYFQTSPSTIRRCLKELEKNKIIEIVRGGASLRGSGNTFEHPYSVKRRRNEMEKKRIATYAASLVTTNHSIYLDSSSTVREMTDPLQYKNGISICTNDVLIANDLSSAKDIIVMVTGGVLRQGFSSLSGYFADHFVNRMQVDFAFMGIDAISTSNGLMLTSVEEISAKRVVGKKARQLIILADHEKFQNNAFLKTWDFDEISLVITGNELPDVLFQKYTDLGLKIKRV